MGGEGRGFIEKEEVWEEEEEGEGWTSGVGDGG